MAEHRHRAKGVLFGVWPVAILLNWVAPADSGFWDAVRMALGAIWVGASIVFVVGWTRARRAGDPTAQVDARVVLALGALVAAGIAVLAEDRSGSTGIGTVVLVILLVPALAAYAHVATTAP